MIVIIFCLLIIIGTVGYLIIWSLIAKSKEKEYEGLPVLFSGAANHFVNGESVGGRLLLTANQLVFVAHKLNAQTALFQLPMSQISQITPCKTAGLIANGLAIQTTSGTEERFVVHGKNKWILNINNVLAAAKSKTL